MIGYAADTLAQACSGALRARGASKPRVRNGGAAQVGVRKCGMLCACYGALLAPRHVCASEERYARPRYLARRVWILDAAN